MEKIFNNNRPRCAPATGALAIACLLTASFLANADEPAAKPAPEGQAAGEAKPKMAVVIVDGPPIKSSQVMSEKHMKYSPTMTCAECHTQTFDFMSTASSQYITNFPQLSQDEIWEKIVAFLPGRERFALATVRDEQPTATTVDMVLDKEERVLYVVSEQGTEKLLEIRKNPSISAVRYDGWTVAAGGPLQFKSVQIKGTAEVIPASDARFFPALTKYNLVRITKERAARRFDLIKITPKQIYYFDTTLPESQKSQYQLWKRR
jgi:hypothetical protein